MKKEMYSFGTKGMALGLLAVVLTGSGCGAVVRRVYADPVRPPSEVATIATVSGHQARLREVDGVDVWPSPYSSWGNYNNFVYVLPGTHQVSAEWAGGNLTSSPVMITIEAQAGRHYVVSGVMAEGGGYWRPIVELQPRPTTLPPVPKESRKEK